MNDPCNRWLFGEAWGVDAGLELLETTLAAGSPATGRTVDQLALPSGLVVTTVIRAGEPLAASVAGPLRAGDQLLLLSRSTCQADVEALFEGEGRPGAAGPFGPGAVRRSGAS